jgi:hypothetical protein
MLFASVPSQAFQMEMGETRSAVRVSVGIDVFNSPGAIVATGRYGGSWGLKLGYRLYQGSHLRGPGRVLVCSDYMLTFADKIRGGLGIAWIDGENNINGTRWNFDVTIAYDLSNKTFLEYRHQSHGAIFGLRTDVPNGGWNVFGLGYTF